MRRFTALLLVMALTMMLGLVSCGSMEQGMSHLKSSMVKLPRVVTLYAADGSVIQQWDGNFKVEVETGSARFIYQGKAIYISGTFTIIEK